MLRNSVSKKNFSLISLVLLIAPAVMLVAVKPRATHADEGVPFKGTLTVQYIGSQACATDDMNCNACINSSSPSLYVEAQGIANTSMGPLFAEVLKCYNLTGGPHGFGTYTGTLTTIAPNRKDSLTWAYLGQNNNAGDFYTFGPFSGTLTTHGGNGKICKRTRQCCFFDGRLRP